MGLNTNALTSLERVKRFLTIENAGQEAELEAAINTASTAIEGYCGRVLKRRQFTNERIAGPLCGGMLYPTRTLTFPIKLDSPITIKVNEIAQTVWRSEADGAPADFDIMARPRYFFRREGWAPTLGYPDNVLLTFMGGYDPIPDDLQDACGYVVQRMWGLDQQQQVTELATLTPPSAAGGAVTFRSRAYVFPGPALDILLNYRIYPVG